MYLVASLHSVLGNKRSQLRIFLCFVDLLLYENMSLEEEIELKQTFFCKTFKQLLGYKYFRYTLYFIPSFPFHFLSGWVEYFNRPNFHSVKFSLLFSDYSINLQLYLTFFKISNSSNYSPGTFHCNLVNTF